MELSKLKLKTETIRESSQKIINNRLIADYYNQLFQESTFQTFKNRSDSVARCFRLWDIDHYRKQSVKDIKHINLCKDKFCKNCQNVISKKRFSKFKPMLDKLAVKNNILHVVFTVPNVTADSLNLTLDKMYKKFPYIIQYFQGKRKAKGIDFQLFGFRGCVRSLEITTNKENGVQMFHPHFHCLFVFKNAIDETKKYTNHFSFNFGKFNRKFSFLEILLQKMWFLIFTDKRFTANNVENIPEGFSVTADNAHGDYKDVFKYTLKESFDDIASSFDIFKTLYNALHRRKIIQGYGELNRFDFEEDISDEEVDLYYENIIKALSTIETPERQYLKLEEVLNDLQSFENITYISKSSIRGAMKNE